MGFSERKYFQNKQSQYEKTENHEFESNFNLVSIDAM
jgi:hypothetical protein